MPGFAKAAKTEQTQRRIGLYGRILTRMARLRITGYRLSEDLPGSGKPDASSIICTITSEARRISIGNIRRLLPPCLTRFGSGWTRASTDCAWTRLQL